MKTILIAKYIIDPAKLPSRQAIISHTLVIVNPTLEVSHYQTEDQITVTMTNNGKIVFSEKASNPKTNEEADKWNFLWGALRSIESFLHNPKTTKCIIDLTEFYLKEDYDIEKDDDNYDIEDLRKFTDTFV